MTLEERLAAVEQELADLRRQRLREAVKDLQEAMTVTSHAQARLERSHQDHREWLESHNKAMTEHAQAMREIDERTHAIVSAIGELTVRIGIPPKPPL
jgi:chromosome segregation ATPase